MKVDIFNLGPIKTAFIDLRKHFTLFCGANNTGKTYLSYILYALHNYYGYINLIDSRSLAQRLYKEQEIELHKADIDGYIANLANHIENALGDIFDVGDSTIDNLFKNFKIELSLSEEEFNQLTMLPFKIGTRIKTNEIYLIKEDGKNRISYQISENLKQSDKDIISRLNFLLCHMIQKLCMDCLGCAHILTVERNSIYTFKTELSIRRNELIENILHAKENEQDIIHLVNSKSKRYPLVIRDSLNVANDLENIQKHDSPYHDIAELIENDILNGKVQITKNGEVVFVPNNMSQTKPLPIYLSSSIVKTMSSLIIYLKHLAHEGDLLIIDEPEMNFHPKVQILLMKYFAMMSKRNLRLIISTHSDYLVREVNNLIMANTIYPKAKELIEGYEYLEHMLLDKNDVAVKYFSFTNNKKTIEVIDEEIFDDGFSIESIDKAINCQNEITEAFYNRLIELTRYE